jgi:predicted transcriptional regulator
MSNIAPKSKARLDRERILVWFCGNTLKKVMIDFDIDNPSLAALAGVDPSYVSRLRNGTLNQRNFIKVIRGLPIAARKEYVDRIFFADIPEKLSPDILAKIEAKVAKRQARQNRQDSVEEDSPEEDSIES